MSGYKKMYYKLFNEMTDIINQIKSVQQETEEMLLSQDDTTIEEIKLKPKIDVFKE